MVIDDCPGPAVSLHNDRGGGKKKGLLALAIRYNKNKKKFEKTRRHNNNRDKYRNEKLCFMFFAFFFLRVGRMFLLEFLSLIFFIFQLFMDKNHTASLYKSLYKSVVSFYFISFYFLQKRGS